MIDLEATKKQVKMFKGSGGYRIEPKNLIEIIDIAIDSQIKVVELEKLISDRNENMAYEWLVESLRDNGQTKESYAVAQLIELWRLANENYEFEKNKKISAPARVAGRIFRAGDKESELIKAAQRQYEFNPPASIDDAVCFANKGHDYGDNEPEPK